MKECNPSTPGETNEFYLQVAPQYIDDWVDYIPTKLPEIPAPAPMQELVAHLDQNAENAILFLQARDLLRDTSQALGNFKKPAPEGKPENPARFTFRPMAEC